MRRVLNGQMVGFVLLALSVGVNVMQAQKLRAVVSPTGTRGALVGTKATPIEARASNGQPMRLGFDTGMPTVLYYFSASCEWCDRNWANIEALAANAGNRYRLVAITTDQDVKEYVAKRGLRVEVMEAVPGDVLQAYRFSLTPQTVVVDAAGLVTHEWRGAFNNKIASKVEALFGIALPGLSPATTKRPN